MIYMLYRLRKPAGYRSGAVAGRRGPTGRTRRRRLTELPARGKLSVVERRPDIRRVLTNLLLVLILCAAQAGIALHGAEHDAQTAQSSLCAACIAADHLTSASVDVGSAAALTVCGNVPHVTPQRAVPAARTHHAHPRGPPAAA